MFHVAIAVVIQVVLGFATGNWWYGAAASLIFVGREQAQAEYRWIERYGSRLRANMPWWGGFDPKVWNLKSLLDFALPVAVTVTVALLVGSFK